MKDFSYPTMHHTTAKALSDIHRVVSKTTGFHMRPGMSMDKALVEIARAMRLYEREAQYIYSLYDNKELKFLARYMPKAARSRENTDEQN